MKDRSNLQKLLEKCIKIKDDINLQIPLAANRYEEFECVPTDITPKDTKLYAEKFSAHQKHFIEQEIEYHLYENINKLFNQFIIDERIQAPQLISTSQKDNFKQIIFKDTNRLYGQLKRSFEILYKNISAINPGEIDDFLKDNVVHSFSS